MTLRIIEPGVHTTIQDLGRPGMAGAGIPRSGAADRGALKLANRLLHNDPRSAAFETTLGGLVVETTAAGWFVVTGAPCPVTVDGRPVGANSPFFVGGGRRIALGAPSAGLRSYLAINGGLDSPKLLGSRSQDTLSGIVPQTVTRGARVAVGEPTPWLSDVDVVAVPPIAAEPVVRIWAGPRVDWLQGRSRDILADSTYTVTSELNRVGVRLLGPTLERAVHDELPSEGLIPGAMQLPPSGQPIIFLADHPTTGGYPVVAVVHHDDLDVLAQLVPGQSIRLRMSSAS